MAGPLAAIHVLPCGRKTGMRGTSPRMTLGTIERNTQEPHFLWFNSPAACDGLEGSTTVVRTRRPECENTCTLVHFMF
jgi:hypothetical protein